MTYTTVATVKSGPPTTTGVYAIPECRELSTRRSWRLALYEMLRFEAFLLVLMSGKRTQNEFGCETNMLVGVCFLVVVCTELT
jgi:hypothetical protein